MIEDNIVEQGIRDISDDLSQRLYDEGLLSYESMTREAFIIIYNYLYNRYEEKSSII